MASSLKESASDGDDSLPKSDSKRLFSGGEKVLAYYGPRIYEAKVQKAEFRKNKWRYFLHYLGWNKNWDEWVTNDRLMKYTEENKMKRKALDKKDGVDKITKSGRSSLTKPKDAKADKEEAKTTDLKGKKRKVESVNEENRSTEKLIRIRTPPSLKKQLVDDWEYIMQQDKVCEMASSSKKESASDRDDSSTESDSERPFTTGEKVLAYHGARIYEAKVQKAEFRKNEWRYFLHYLGWNKNWDEWVTNDRLMKYTEKNKMKQKALDKKAGADKSTKSGHSSQTKPKNSTDAKVDDEEAKTTNVKGKRRKVESVDEENRATEKLIQIQMPTSLKKQLVDDGEYIMHQNKLVKLPRSPNVDDVLTKYLEDRREMDGRMTSAVGEVLNRLRSYFDKALPSILLYAEERQQYRDAIADNVSPSTVYGPEHLLRLFVKLPEVLPDVLMDEESAISLQKRLLEFLKYLQDNQSSFFSVNAYEVIH